MKSLGFPGGPSGKEFACQCRRRGFNAQVRKGSWSGKWQPAPVCLPGKFQDRGAWLVTVHGVAKSWT